MSFRNVFGYTLGAMGHSIEATDLCDEQLEDARTSSPRLCNSVYTNSSGTCGVWAASYVRAEELLNEAEDRALAAGDRTAYHIAWAFRTRLYCAQGAFDLALSRAFDSSESMTKSLRSELAGAYAVPLAAIGEADRAQKLAAHARFESKCIEGTISSHAADAIVALQASAYSSALDHARAALTATVRSGMIETFVSAYRGTQS